MYSTIFALVMAAIAGGICIIGWDEWVIDNTGPAKVAWIIAAMLWLGAVGIVA